MKPAFLPFSGSLIPLLTEPSPQTLQCNIFNRIWKAFDSSCQPFTPAHNPHCALPHKREHRSKLCKMFFIFLELLICLFVPEKRVTGREMYSLFTVIFHAQEIDLLWSPPTSLSGNSAVPWTASRSYWKDACKYPAPFFTLGNKAAEISAHLCQTLTARARNAMGRTGKHGQAGWNYTHCSWTDLRHWWKTVLRLFNSWSWQRGCLSCTCAFSITKCHAGL